MSLRALIQEKRGVAFLVVAVCLALAGWIAFGPGIGGGGADLSKHRYFYDMQTGELFTHPGGMEHLPPITRENGNEAVLAHVFACGECKNAEPDDLRVGYIEKYTEEGKQQVRAPNEDEEVENFAPYEGAVSGAAQLVAIPGEEPQWVSQYSNAGTQIVTQVKRSVCPNGTAVECYPGQN